jgi:hypothetical protein
MLLVYLCTALVSHTAAPVARALSRAAERLASALDDAKATTLALAFGRIDRRTPRGERRAADRTWHNEFNIHYHQTDEGRGD